MKTISYNSNFFNVKDTLTCGQTFRYFPYEKGYLVISDNKLAYAYNQNEKAIICCNDSDVNYFYNYFDLDTDYSKIYNSAINSGYKILSDSAKFSKGVRILKQNVNETIISFIISQNNNISRIQSLIEKTCANLGEKLITNGITYNAFPSMQVLSEQSEKFYEQLSFGYRAKYIGRMAKILNEGFVKEVINLPTEQLKKQLLNQYGIGEKVANCILLFGFNRLNCFPVDTWLKKVYYQNFNGTLSNAKQITKWYENTFKEFSGYFQQYLFYAKRSNVV